MDYTGFMQEQTKAQIRSTRGETIDLALPAACTVGELRSFLIDEYNYDSNTRLLYNGGITADATRVCDYPYGSLMIATPADMQPQRQPLPPRQTQQPYQQPQPYQQQQQQQQPFQQRPTEPVRTSPRTSPRPASGSSRRGKPTEPATNASAPRRPTQADGGSPEAGKKSRNTGGSTIVKHPPKKSPRLPRSTSAESNHSDGAAPMAPAPVDASPPPPTAATRERPSPSHAQSGNSGRKPASRLGSARNPPSARAAAAPQDAAEAAPSPAPPPPPPPPESAAAAANAPMSEEDELTHRRRVRFTVECSIPSLKRSVFVQMNGESSVVDLVLAVVAEAPEIGGEAQVIYRGKILPQNQRAKLFDLGMRADTRVFIAAGDYSNPETITLLEIERDTDEIDKAMKGGGLTDLQRKGYYEELMRILFRTDGLLSLEGEWRQRRKDAVKRITALQDALGVEGKVA